MEAHIQIGKTVIEVVAQDLLHALVPAIMLSANNELQANPTRPSRSLDVERQAGRAYREECEWLSAAGGPGGLHQGSAVVTGAGELALTTPIRWVIQAVTIHYDKNKHRTPATPAIVYGAVRAG